MGSHFSGSSDPSPETPETRLPSCFSKSRPVLSKVQAVTIRSSFKFKDKLKGNPRTHPPNKNISEKTWHFKQNTIHRNIPWSNPNRGKGQIHQFRGHQPSQSAVDTLICSLYHLFRYLSLLSIQVFWWVNLPSSIHVYRPTINSTL